MRDLRRRTVDSKLPRSCSKQSGLLSRLLHRAIGSHFLRSWIDHVTCKCFHCNFVKYGVFKLPEMPPQANVCALFVIYGRFILKRMRFRWACFLFAILVGTPSRLMEKHRLTTNSALQYNVALSNVHMYSQTSGTEFGTIWGLVSSWRKKMIGWSFGQSFNP